MKTVLPILLSLCASLAFAANPPDEPGDMYVRAFLLMQDAAKLEKKGALPDAIRNCKQASAILDAIRVRFPQWQPVIVDFRRKKVIEMLNKLDPHPDVAQSGERASFAAGKNPTGSGKRRLAGRGALRRAGDGLLSVAEESGGQVTPVCGVRRTPQPSRRPFPASGGLCSPIDDFFPKP